MKLFKELRNYKDKNGNDKQGYNFWLEFDNGNRVMINPAIIKDKNGNKMLRDYYILFGNSETLSNGK